jgi:hypothetical protein
MWWYIRIASRPAGQQIPATEVIADVEPGVVVTAFPDLLALLLAGGDELLVVLVVIEQQVAQVEPGCLGAETDPDLKTLRRLLEVLAVLPREAEQVVSDAELVAAVVVVGQRLRKPRHHRRQQLDHRGVLVLVLELLGRLVRGLELLGRALLAAAAQLAGERIEVVRPLLEAGLAFEHVDGERRIGDVDGEHVRLAPDRRDREISGWFGMTCVDGEVEQVVETTRGPLQLELGIAVDVLDAPRQRAVERLDLGTVEERTHARRDRDADVPDPQAQAFRTGRQVRGDRHASIRCQTARANNRCGDFQRRVA